MLERMLRVHVLLWLGSFFVWNYLFVVSLCALIFPYSAPILLAHWIVWKLIWTLTICSLLSAALTKPAHIDERFKLPEELVKKHSVRILHAAAAWAHLNQLPVRFRRMATESGLAKAPNYCFICGLIKPDRAHHCGRCNRCVLRMDHHCPVLAECIHLHNHKYFMLFLLFASILCVFAALTIFPVIVPRFVLIYYGAKLSRMVPTILITSGAVNAMICGVALLCFSWQLTMSLLRNETTLEGISLHEFGEEGAFGDGMAHYDLGSKSSNFKSVFGTNPWLWFLPLPSTEGNGCEFKYSVNCSSVKCSITDDDDTESSQSSYDDERI